MAPYSQFLSFVGLFSLASLIQRVASFIHLHFLHRSTLPAYSSLRSTPNNPSSQTASYALITGASDGIGLGFAQELLSSGFNVILHGRNPTKLDKAKAQLQQQYPNRDVRVFILDASDEPSWPIAISSLVTTLEDPQIILRVLINNVGGGPASPLTTFSKTLERPAAATAALMNLNAAFPATLTHALLPALARNQPSFIINVGSASAVLSLAHLGLYSSCKSFLSKFSRCLSIEMKAEGVQVEVFNVIVGKTLNQSSGEMKPSLFVPTSRDLAKAALGKVGSGRAECVAWWPHAMQLGLLGMLPEWVQLKAMEAADKEEMEAERKKN